MQLSSVSLVSALLTATSVGGPEGCSESGDTPIEPIGTLTLTMKADLDSTTAKTKLLWSNLSVPEQLLKEGDFPVSWLQVVRWQAPNPPVPCRVVEVEGCAKEDAGTVYWSIECSDPARNCIPSGIEYGAAPPSSGEWVVKAGPLLIPARGVGYSADSWQPMPPDQFVVHGSYVGESSGKSSVQGFYATARTPNADITPASGGSGRAR